MKNKKCKTGGTAYQKVAHDPNIYQRAQIQGINERDVTDMFGNEYRMNGQKQPKNQYSHGFSPENYALVSGINLAGNMFANYVDQGQQSFNQNSLYSNPYGTQSYGDTKQFKTGGQNMNYYQEGGQQQDMQQVMQQIMQSFQQLPPEAQQQLIQAMAQMMQQDGQEEQQAQQMPMQKRGGFNRNPYM